MNYWLFKSEPTSFSIDHLHTKPKQTTHWDGVRNYQARNMLRDQVAVGDQVFFYHSNCETPGIVGCMEVVKKGYPDFTAFDPENHHYDPKSTPEKPQWYMVDVRLIKKFPRVISLEEIKQDPILCHMQVAKRGNRLSISPVTAEQWDQVLNLSTPQKQSRER